MSDKFDITKHKRYRELSDYDEKNAFDVEAYMKHQLKIRRQEEFDLYEVDGNEAEEHETEKISKLRNFATPCRKVRKGENAVLHRNRWQICLPTYSC